MKDKRTTAARSKVPFHIPTIPRPQDEYNIIVNNNNQSFDHVWLETSTDGSWFIHPLEKFSVVDFVDRKCEGEPVQPLPLKSTPFKLVEGVNDLKMVAAKLQGVDEFAVSSFEVKIQPVGMETVVVVGSHRSKYYSRGKSQPSRDFGGFSCRSFESATRVLPSRCSRLCYWYGFSEPKSPSFYSDQQQKQRRKRKTISPNTPPSPKGDAFSEKASCSERWAGPAYSNSPPPSCLPIPTFSLRQKRSVSLEIQIPISDVVLHSLSKSAPTSPTRESPSSATNFLFDTAIATENLRRILQLDIADD